MTKVKFDKILNEYLNDIYSVTSYLESEGKKIDPSKPWQHLLEDKGDFPKARLHYERNGTIYKAKYQKRIVLFDCKGSDHTIPGVRQEFAALYIQSLGLDGFDDLTLCREHAFKTFELLNRRGVLILKGDTYFTPDNYAHLLRSLNPRDEALMEAVSYFDIDAVKKCLVNGADPNYRQASDEEDVNGYIQPTTPLRMVMFRISDSLLEEKDLKAFAEITSILLQHGADPKPALEIAESRYGKYDPKNHEEGNLLMDVYRIVAMSKL